MLFPHALHHDLQDGTITVAFRRWRVRRYARGGRFGIPAASRRSVAGVAPGPSRRCGCSRSGRVLRPVSRGRAFLDRQGA